MTSGNNECDATIPASIPWSTAGTGVAYSTGYSLRWSSMAFLTRSSSSMLTVLIHVIGYPPLFCSDSKYLVTKNQRPDGCASGRKCLGCLRGASFGLAGSDVL